MRNLRKQNIKSHFKTVEYDAYFRFIAIPYSGTNRHRFITVKAFHTTLPRLSDKVVNARHICLCTQYPAVV